MCTLVCTSVHLKDHRIKLCLSITRFQYTLIVLFSLAAFIFSTNTYQTNICNSVWPLALAPCSSKTGHGALIICHTLSIIENLDLQP